MKYTSIDEIYTVNAKIRERLRATIDKITESELTLLPAGEKWTIQQLVEHVAIVEHNIARICAKLLEAAKSIGKPSDGSLAVTEDFTSQWASVDKVRLEAPERVQPTGNVSIAAAYEQMDASRQALAELRPDFETYDLSGSKFPHPHFGDLSATEWFILSGGHEARHITQIEQLLEKIRQ
jgi:hypothetical protein